MANSPRTFDLIDKRLEMIYSALFLIVGLIMSFGSTALYATMGTQVVLEAAFLGFLILLFFNAHFISNFAVNKYLTYSVRNLFFSSVASVLIIAALGAFILSMTEKQPVVDVAIRSTYVYVLIGEVMFWIGRVSFYKLKLSQRV